MSESDEALAEIGVRIRGKTLLVGRRIGQEKFDTLGAALRVEAKPQKYATSEDVIAWEPGLLGRFPDGAFDCIVLHRFLYKPVKEHIEDPRMILAEVKRILPTGGVLVVNSFVLNDATRGFGSADSFFTELEMKNLLGGNFMITSCVAVRDARIFACEKQVTA
jgi:hypothetical protein